jgi:hypothetical protein
MFEFCVFGLQKVFWICFKGLYFFLKNSIYWLKLPFSLTQLYKVVFGHDRGSDSRMNYWIKSVSLLCLYKLGVQAKNLARIEGGAIDADQSHQALFRWSKPFYLPSASTAKVLSPFIWGYVHDLTFHSWKEVISYILCLWIASRWLKCLAW